MKTKRLPSLLLALLLVVNLCVPAMAAESTALKLSVDNADPVVGDTITVTVSGYKEMTNLQTLAFDLYLDNEAYKLKEFTIFGDVNPDYCEVTDNLVNYSSINFSGFDLRNNPKLELFDGAIVTFTFEVIGASTEPFQIKDAAAYVKGEPDNNLVAETSEELQVTAKEPPAPELPEFDAFTVDVTKMKKVSSFNYYCAIPAGKDLKIRIPNTGAVGYVTNSNANKAMEFYYTEGEVIITAEELQNAYLPVGNDYRVEQVEAYVDLAEGSEVVFFYVGAYSPEYYAYNIIVEILAESGCDEHDWQDATCDEPKTCLVCGNIEGKALGHDWVVTTPEVPAVCETSGTTAIESCNRDGCDATQGGTEIPAPGHTWESTGVTKQPTCTEPCEENFICIATADCDGKKTEPVAALGHTWDEGEVTTQPTCTKKGVKTFHCTVCEDGTKTEEVPANGHKYEDGYCSVCKKMEPTEIPFTDANHTSNGNAFNKHLAGVDCLVVDGIAISDWTEWTGSMNKNITIYVDPVYKNAPVTISLKAKDGYTGTLGLFASPVTVNLSEGVGEYLARSNQIGSANFGCFVYFKLGECTGEHTWEEATCTEPMTCSVCGATDGEADPDAHNYVDGECEYCGESEAPVNPGYTFATSADISAENGGTATVHVKITGHSDPTITKYNAYDVTLTFDSDKLEYVSYDGAVKSDGGSVTVTANEIRIVGCGEDKSFGTEIVALTFETKAEGTADVTISKVQVSDKEEAVTENIPEASAKHAENDANADTTPDVSVVIVPFTVIKPDFISGEKKVLYGETYTFSYTDTTNYTYSDLTVKVGGTVVTPTEKDGVYTITNVTGPVEITATQTANSYDVTKPKSVSGPDKATYGTDYEFTVTPSANMLVDSVKVTLTGSEEEIAYTSADGKYIIAGSKISGPITITVTEKPVAQNTTISFEGIATDEIQGGSLTVTVPVGETYTFQLLKTELYTYTAKVGETVLTESAETAGSYTIPGELVVANGITVQIEKNEIKNLAVDVNEYITLDGNAMFLVTAKWGDKVLAYGDETMIYSSKYTVTGQTQGAYCWLVLSTDELNSVDAVKAAAQAAIVEAAEGATATAVKYNYDINGTTKVDVNDAQLVYDMYNASYMEFTQNLPMLKFLEADMETDAKLDTKDVAAIISYIVNGTAN